STMSRTSASITRRARFRKNTGRSWKKMASNTTNATCGDDGSGVATRRPKMRRLVNPGVETPGYHRATATRGEATPEVAQPVEPGVETPGYHQKAATRPENLVTPRSLR